ALLQSASAERAVCLRWPAASLPCFTAWKNTMALEEGYVTGLEPATGYPNFRTFERSKGRGKLLPPGGAGAARWSLEVADNADAVVALQAEVAKLQAQAKMTVHRTPQPRFSPG